MKKADLALMNEIMVAVTDTKEWREEQLNNPEILSAKKRLDDALRRLAASGTPANIIDEITDAVYWYATASDDAAILYGIHVANTIRDIAARPSDLSKYILSIREATS